MRLSKIAGMILVAVSAACTVAAPAPTKSKKSTDGVTANPKSPSSDEGSGDNNDGDGREDGPENGGPSPAARPGITAFPGSKIFMPDHTPAPAILLLHGSEGGGEPFIHDFAQELAKDGFVTVSMCWFGCPNKPDKILRIALESIVELGQWLATSPDVTNKKVGLFGWSRGAELSLLVTSLLNTDPFKAVAVHAPSDTVVSAFDPATQNNPPNFGGILENNVPAPSWLFKGQAIFGEPKADFSVAGPKIAVEKYTGAVYVSQGENDEVWEVARGKRVVATRKAVSGLVTESHFFPNEGHVLQQQANIDTRHREIASFFKRNLAP